MIIDLNPETPASFILKVKNVTKTRWGFAVTVAGLVKCGDQEFVDREVTMVPGDSFAFNLTLDPVYEA